MFLWFARANPRGKFCIKVNANYFNDRKLVKNAWKWDGIGATRQNHWCSNLAGWSTISCIQIIY